MMAIFDEQKEFFSAYTFLFLIFVKYFAQFGILGKYTYKRESSTINS